MSTQRYLVAARKYRPQLFGELVSQDHVTETLKNAIRLDRLAHAYLFSGPRGVGKTTAARILAKAINCTTPMDQRGDGAEPCRQCESCRSFEEGRSLSIIEIDAASNNKVEDVRELRDTVRIPPQGNRKKVYIIDEVHMLTNQAFNALLKTLEEPPPYVLFIFATTEPHKVLPTILSRCQRFDFRRIPTTEIVTRLGEICSTEGITADENSLMLIARKGDGALRDALSAFDQAVSLCGSTLQYNELIQALGVVDVDLFFETTEYIVRKSAAGMLRLVDQIVRAGYDLHEYLSGLAEHLRNLLVARTMPDTSLIEATELNRQRYGTACRAFDEPQLLRLLSIVSEAEESVKNSAQPRLRLELALLKMAQLPDTVDLRLVLQKLEKLEASGFQEENPVPRAIPPVTDTGSTGPASPRTAAAPSVRVPAPESVTPAADGSRFAPVDRPAPEPQVYDVPVDYLTTSPVPPPAPIGARSNEAPPAASSQYSFLGPPALARRGAPGRDSRNGPSASTGGLAVAAADTLTLEAPPAVASINDISIRRISDAWPDLVRIVMENRIQVGALLKHTRPVTLIAGALTISVPDEFHQRMLESQREFLQSQIDQTLSERVSLLHFEIGKNQETEATKETVQEIDPYEYMQRKRQENPVIRAIFEQFGGELVW